MNWYHSLYLGKTAKRDEAALIRAVEDKKPPLDVYLLTLPENPENQLEILPSLSFRFRYQEKDCPMIVGLARGRKEALELFQKIVEDVLSQTGKPDLGSYFRERS